MKNNCNLVSEKLDINQDTNSLIEESYSFFKTMLNANNLYFNNKKLLLKNEKDLHTMKELGFEHIVSIKNHLGLRIYEKNRMIYLPLIEKIFKNCCVNKCEDIKIYKDRGDICIWCKKLDYLIVVTPRKDFFLLQTAYPIIYEKKRKEVEKKANENGII